MPFNEISGIKAAEDAAVKTRLDAQSAASAAEAETEKAGAAQVFDVRRRAENESAALLCKAEKDASEFAEKLRGETVAQRTALRAAAGQRMDAAASIIVKKVVEG